MNVSVSGSDPFDVIVVGSCMIDLVSYVGDLPRPGETIHGRTFSQGFGGKGANQCVMAARLGARCAMVAKLGNDSFGVSTIKNFKDNSINTDFVSVTNVAASGVASITVNDKGENAIVIVAGANLTLAPAEVAMAKAMVRRAKVMICQLEIAPKTTLKALKMAKELGVLTILNTAPALQGLEREYFENTDILCLNETEAEVLTKLAVTDLASAAIAVEALQALGSKCIVLTLGEKGLVYSMLVGNEWTSIEHLSAIPVNVVDTTGAGDAFVGALACYLATKSQPSEEGVAIEPESLEIFLKMAATVASHTVTAKGTQTSFKVDNFPKELLAGSCNQS